MKRIMCTLLTMAALSSLNACSGQTNLNAPAPAAPVQAAANTSFMAPAQQTDANLQADLVNQQPQQHSTSTSPAANTPVVPGSRSYSKDIFDKPTTAKPTSAAQPEVTKPTVTAKPTTSTPAPVASAKPSSSQVAQQLLAQAVERFQSLESFKIHVDGFETLVGKSPSNLSFDMFSLNGKSKIQVTKHTNSMYVGVKMGYQAGADSLSVRPGGILGIVKVDTKMTDERVTTPRGYRLDQIDAFALSKRLLGGTHQPKVLGKTQLNGRSVAILEYTGANDYDPRITRELLAIDMEDHFVRMHEMYEGDTLVFSLKLSNIQLNAPVTAAELTI